MGETAKASPARLPRGLLQVYRDCQNSCVPLTCAFFFWHFLGRQNALHMFHLAMFSEAILSMDAEVA